MNCYLLKTVHFISQAMSTGHADTFFSKCVNYEMLYFELKASASEGNGWQYWTGTLLMANIKAPFGQTPDNHVNISGSEITAGGEKGRPLSD